MYRFLLKQNVARYQRLLQGETKMRLQAALRSDLAVWQRDLAILDAETRGAPPSVRRSAHGPLAKQFLREFEALEGSALLMDPGPGLHVVHVNEALARATLVDAGRVCGERLFTAFPDNPRPEADGVSRLYDSLRIAACTGRPHAMPVQRYDVRAPDGQFFERWWRPVNTPILDEEDRPLYLLHQVEDVTAQVLQARRA